MGLARHLGATAALLEGQHAVGIDFALELRLEGRAGRLRQFP
ncbi:MAG: hypothetical protein ACLQHS_03930 [Candidatus Limnocylindrales bacterium]